MNGRATIFEDDRRWADLRERVRAGEAATAAAAEGLRQRAAAWCAAPRPAVTDKQFTPHSPSHDGHDYVSVGTYWWPNPDTADGLPYVHRDGQLSPDLELYDRPRWDRGAAAIVTTARAAYFLDEPRFAAEATARLRRWFLDPATRMAPHLAYGQMIPGRCTGGRLGIVDFALYLPAVLDHAAVLADLADSPWTPRDRGALAAWCGALLGWLESHPYGRAEEECANNHGTWYDRLVVALALALDRPERARAQLRKTRDRIPRQIAADGSMPAELARTCSFGYTTMNLRAFVDLARVGRRLGVDLWAVGGDSGDGGGGIAAAVAFVLRHARGTAPWPWPQIEPCDWRMFCPIVAAARELGTAGDGGKGADAQGAGGVGGADAGGGSGADAGGGALAGLTTGLAQRLPAGFDPALLPLDEPLHPFGAGRSPVPPLGHGAG